MRLSIMPCNALLWPKLVPCAEWISVYPASRSTEFMKLVAHGHRDKIVHPTVTYDTAMWTTEAL